MRRAVLLLLVLSAVLVVQTDAGWFRRTVNKIKDKVKNVVNKVKEFVNKHKGTIQTVIDIVKNGRRKREVEGEGAGASEGLAELLAELQMACPTFGITPGDCVGRDVMNAAFLAADANGDSCLDEEEMEMFENIIETIQECIALEGGELK